MKNKCAISITVLFIVYLACFETGAFAHPNHKNKAVEDALLQQLQPAIISSLKEIYKEEYSQFGCERIISINAQETIKKNEMKAKQVDAIRGGKFFEIKVALCRPDGHTVELDLKNDTADAHYYLARYKVH